MKPTRKEIAQACYKSMTHHLNNMHDALIGIDLQDISIDAVDCALCQLFRNDCHDCVLHDHDTDCCKEYSLVRRMRVKRDVKAFIDAENKLVMRLYDLWIEYSEPEDKALDSKSKGKGSPKFKVGDECWWNGVLPQWDLSDKPPCKVTISDYDGSRYWVDTDGVDLWWGVDEDSLSPMPELKYPPDVMMGDVAMWMCKGNSGTYGAMYVDKSGIIWNHYCGYCQPVHVSNYNEIVNWLKSLTNEQRLHLIWEE